MNRAVICRQGGAIEELDLAEATPEEREQAITDHRELEVVRVLIRVNPEQESCHGMD